MKRKQFIAAVSLAVPFISLGIPKLSNQRRDDQSDLILNDTVVGKALHAMLCMQRQSWEQGTASQALIAIGRRDLAILFAKDAIVHQTADGRLGVLGNDQGVTDPASNGESVWLAYKETGDEKFKTALNGMYDFLKNKAPKTADGILYHIKNAKQIWSDTSFMAPPFIALMRDFDEAVKQYEGLRKYLMNKEKKLYYHMWDDEKSEFKRKLFWGGGNGWTAAGLAKTIRLIPSDRNDLRNKLIGFAKEVIDGCLAFQRPDGLFHDIIDDPGSFVETNLGQMLAFAIYTGIKDGWLPAGYKEKADRMRLASRLTVDDFGIVQGACGSPDFNKPGTSTEAQAFFLMMESAYSKLN